MHVLSLSNNNISALLLKDLPCVLTRTRGENLVYSGEDLRMHA